MSTSMVLYHLALNKISQIDCLLTNVSIVAVKARWSAGFSWESIVDFYFLLYKLFRWFDFYV